MLRLLLIVCVLAAAVQGGASGSGKITVDPNAPGAPVAHEAKAEDSRLEQRITYKVKLRPIADLTDDLTKLTGITFRSGITGFVEIVREGHPGTPIVLVSPILAPPHEEEPNAVGLTLVKMREEVEHAVTALCRHGARNVHYLDGRELLGPADVSYLNADGVHPSAEGYKLMGRHFLDKVAKRVFA